MVNCTDSSFTEVVPFDQTPLPDAVSPIDMHKITLSNGGEICVGTRFDHPHGGGKQTFCHVFRTIRPDTKKCTELKFSLSLEAVSALINLYDGFINESKDISMSLVDQLDTLRAERDEIILIRDAWFTECTKLRDKLATVEKQLDGAMEALRDSKPDIKSWSDTMGLVQEMLIKVIVAVTEKNK
jgi:hypothetical protein